MKSPGLPRDESTRLATLHSIDILDSSPEERFDRLTRLAQRMFRVPIALVSLIDEDRQWFKSCVGLDVAETPRDISFCGHAILGDEIFLVENALLDERFADNPLVSGAPHIRFYAGCPLRYFDGSRLGTLCIIDTKSRTLAPEDRLALKDLAELAERELAAVELATLDDLTGLPNRRGFLTMAEKAVNLCDRESIPESLVFLDLDGFKDINDRYGHAEGDKALLTFANLIKSSFRKSDICARLGGDEFAALLPKATAALAKESIVRLRESVAEHNAKAQAGYDLAFSEGIVEVDRGYNTTIEALLSQADAKMYREKRKSASGADVYCAPHRE